MKEDSNGYAALDAAINRRDILAALLVGAAAGSLATVALINLL